MDSVTFWFCDPKSEEKFCFIISYTWLRISLEIQSVQGVMKLGCLERDPSIIDVKFGCNSCVELKFSPVPVYLAPTIHPGSWWRQLFILISCSTSWWLAVILLEVLCIRVLAFFHFLAIFLVLRFTSMTWTMTGAAASGPLEFPRTNWQRVQVQSEDNFYSLPFHLLSWGSPTVKASGNLKL